MSRSGRSRPTVVLVNAYIRENAGDAALLSVCLQQARLAAPDRELLISGLENPEERPDFEGVANLGSARRHVADGDAARSTRIFRRLLFVAWFAPYLLLPSPLRRLVRRLLPGEIGAEIRAVSRADLVVSIGGGYVQAAPGLDGLQNLVFVLAPLAAAAREGRPVVAMPQSFGPFRGPAQRWLVRAVMGRARLVCAREEISRQALLDAGVPAECVVLAADSGFALTPPPVDPATAQPDGRIRIGLTARRFLEPTAQAAYETTLAALIDDLQAAGHAVTLVPQVTTDYLGDDDRLTHERIAAACQVRPTVVDDTADYRKRLEQYAGLDLLIGTRFHSVIFALVNHVPCVAIAYEHKTRGIMRRIGLEQWVVDMADVADGDRLTRLVGSALADLPRYRARLGETMPAVVADARGVTDLLRAALTGGAP